MSKKNLEGSELAKALGDLSPGKVIREVTKHAIPTSQHDKNQKK